MSLKRKDLLGMADLSVEEIQLILQTADSFKEVSGRDIKKVPTLRGKTVVNLFFEPSTRTGGETVECGRDQLCGIHQQRGQRRDVAGHRE